MQVHVCGEKVVCILGSRGPTYVADVNTVGDSGEQPGDLSG